jgi:hypothetical protein
MSDDELVEAFEACTLPSEAFPHSAHVRVAWWYLSHYPLPVALDRFTTALRRFATAHGAPERYHETITVAYLLLINERKHLTGDTDWNTFAAANADLLAWKPSILDRYYTPETLWSERARRVFVMPEMK